LRGWKLLTKNGLVTSKPEFPADEFGDLSPEESELFLVFEAANISLFPRDEKIIPSLGGGGGWVRGKVKEFPDLGREGALKEEMGNRFRG
jgi:hypothetical protein